MIQTVALEIEDRLLSQLERKARSENVDVQVIAQRAIQKYVLNEADEQAEVQQLDEAREKMDQEIAAYRAMHPQLSETHLGQQVAVFQGQLVDSDPDFLALFLRIQERYPDEVVMMREVRAEADPVYRVLSPRLERD